MPTFEGETVLERYQREAIIEARIAARLVAMRTFVIALFVEGERIVLSAKAECQGDATSKVLEMFDELPRGFTMICKEVKA